MSDRTDLARQRRTLITERRFADAKKITEQMLSAHPSDPTLLNQMAWSMASIRDFAGAIQFQEKAIQISPRNAAYRAALVKYLEGRIAQQRDELERLTTPVVATFAEQQASEKIALANKCEDVLKSCLSSNWIRCIDRDPQLRKKWVLEDCPLDSVPDWEKNVPEKFKEGDVAEIIGIGSFKVSQATSIRNRISRGMPPELPVTILLMEIGMRADPKSIMIEIGANVGLHTIPLALSFPGHIIVVEPVESAQTELIENIRLNAVSNASVLPKMDAVPPQGGATSVSADRTVIAVEPSSSPPASPLQTMIDEEVAIFDLPVSLVRIDVEGHEGTVIEDMRSILRRDKPLVLCRMAGETAQTLAATMKSLGYEGKLVFRSDWMFYPSAV